MPREWGSGDVPLGRDAVVLLLCCCLPRQPSAGSGAGRPLRRGCTEKTCWRLPSTFQIVFFGLSQSPDHLIVRQNRKKIGLLPLPLFCRADDAAHLKHEMEKKMS